MIRDPNLFFESLKTKKVGVIGLGVSHFDLICMMCKKGIPVTVLDRRTKGQIGADYDT